MKKTVGILLFVLALLGIGSIAAAASSIMWTSTNVKPVITLRYTDTLGRNVLNTFTLPGYFEMVQDKNFNLYIRVLALNSDSSRVIAAQALGMGIPQAGGSTNAVLCGEEQLQPYTLTFSPTLTMTAVDALIMDGTYVVDTSFRCSGTITMTAAGTLDVAGGSPTPARMTATFHLPAMPAQAALSGFSVIGRDFVPPPASPTPPTVTNISGNVAFGTTTTISLTKNAHSFQTDQTLNAFTDSNPVNGHISPVSNGKVTYSPNSGFEGSDIFTFHVTDSAGLNSPTQQVLLTVGGTPDTTPVLLTVAKNSIVPTPINFSSLNLGSSFVQSVTPGLGSITNTSGSHAFSYTPPAGFTGFDTLTYTLANNTTSWTATGEVDVEVCPIAVNYFQILGNNNSVQVNVLAKDIPFNANDTSVTLPLSKPLYGTLSVSGGTIIYTLPIGGIPSGVSEDNFTYTITETINGVNQTSTGVVTIILQ
ncbi:MAG: Ig-like domain-containing protein [Nitrospirota bacterium]